MYILCIINIEYKFFEDKDVFIFWLFSILYFKSNIIFSKLWIYI